MNPFDVGANMLNMNPSLRKIGMKCFFLVNVYDFLDALTGMKLLEYGGTNSQTSSEKSSILLENEVYCI